MPGKTVGQRSEIQNMALLYCNKEKLAYTLIKRVCENHEVSSVL